MRPFTTSSILTLLLVFAGLSMLSVRTQGQVGQNFGSLVYIDGKNVIPHAEIILKQDALMSLECYDLMPNSDVTIRIRGGGSKGLDQELMTNPRGAVKQILFFPKARGRMKCTIRYTFKNGKSGRLDFVLKPV